MRISKILVVYLMLVVIGSGLLIWTLVSRHNTFKMKPAERAIFNAILLNGYSDLFKVYAYSTPHGIFIIDPSQGDQIVSEAQAYWLKLSVQLAELFPYKSGQAKQNFDGLLKGTLFLCKLAQDNLSLGEFPAWKALPSNNSVVLDNNGNGYTVDSASDADLDLLFSLIKADNVWGKQDRTYRQLADKLIAHAERNLFDKRRGMLVLKPSEDWNSFLYTDYFSPGTCSLIASYLTATHQPQKRAEFWSQAAQDSIKIYQAVLDQKQEFPAKISLSVDSNQNVEVTTLYNSTQTYDGIRSPFRIAEGLLYGPNHTLKRLAGNTLYIGWDRSYTKPELDHAMYATLAVVLYDQRADELMKTFTQHIPQKYYYENTLRLLALELILLK